MVGRVPVEHWAKSGTLKSAPPKTVRPTSQEWTGLPLGSVTPLSTTVPAGMLPFLPSASRGPGKKRMWCRLAHRMKVI